MLFAGNGGSTVLLAFNVIFVVPFVRVLYLGSGKLYNKAISWKQFIGACIVPLPFLVYWLVKRETVGEQYTHQ